MAQTVTSNITEADIHKAIQKINLSAIPPRRFYTKYYLVINGEKFPPKYVLSVAHKYANGEELGEDVFTAQQAVAFLKKLGFQIEKREEVPTYFEEVKRFLNQANTNDLKYADYKKSFLNLEVSIGFGRGNKAKIPRIAFLNERNTFQKGIYPVYLLYKDQNLFILAYGVSEYYKSENDWGLRQPITISQYFADHDLGQPSRYGTSYVYKVYDLHKPLNKDEMEEDLLDIIDIYNEVEKNTVRPTGSGLQTAFHLPAFLAELKTTGLSFSPSLVTRLVGSLLTKPFVILTGLSGSGKTRLAQAFVQWICRDAQQYCIVPVGADWTNREPLLGYPNALNPQEYVKPDNGALDLIIKANKNSGLPYFLILDEMNLSHVERYFADFLSVMESHETIPLYAKQEQEKSGVPAKIKWPSNLFIIGTVNIDETTNMFSPKVLDRANTIEFRVTGQEMDDFLNSIRGFKKQQLNASGASMSSHFLKLASTTDFSTQEKNKKHVNETLVDFFNALRKVGAEFGYRTATEIWQLIHQLGNIDPTLSLHTKLDIAIMQKLLPKLHGSRRKLCPVLSTLGSLCFTGNVEKEVFEANDFIYAEDDRVLYPLSLEKIARMYKGAIDNGFASFAEA
ncbi:MAG TPA: DUF3578 domain-containing protein [Sphingobacterium sp.]|nr:DUF3578 domain-containing protein [Sphingobacterium sp.]